MNAPHPLGLAALKESRSPGLCLFCREPAVRINGRGRHRLVCRRRECKSEYFRMYQRDVRGPLSADRLGFVYFVQVEGGGPIKIGFAKNVKERIGIIQVFCPYKLITLHTMPGEPVDERRLHDQFRASRTHGEWFQPTAELLEFIDNSRKGT